MKITKRRILRYFGLAVAIVLFLWIATLAALYFFVDVNQVKKIAVSYVNENTRGELGVGEVKLKLFPIVHFEVKDIVFKSSQDFQRKDLFRCDQAKLSFGIWSLIFGNPNISLGLEKPYVDFIVKDTDVNNVSDLMIKKEPVNEPADKKEQVATDKKKDNMSYLFMSRFTFDVNDAEIKYTSAKAKYDVKALSFKLMIDPADKSIELKAGSPLDIKDKKFSLAGDWKTNVEVKPTRDDNFDVYLMFDATKLSYTSPSFVKPKGVPLKLELSAYGNETLLTIKKATFTLFKTWLTMTGKVAGLKEEISPLTLNVLTSPIEAANIKKILPSLKDYEFSGPVESKFAISGTIQKLLLDVELDAINVKMKNENFDKPAGVPLKVKTIVAKSKESIDLQLLKVWLVDDIAEANGKMTDLESEFPTLQMNIKYLNLDLAKMSKIIPAIKKNKLSGSIKASGEVSGKMNPVPYFKFDFKYADAATKNDLAAKISNSPKNVNSFIVDATSSRLDLNGFVPADSKKVASKKGAKSSEPAKPMDKKKELVTKEQIKSMNELLSKYSLAMNLKANKVLFKEFNFNNLIFQANASKGNFTVSKFNTETLGGKIASGLTLIPNISKPAYNANFDVSNLKVKDAVEALMPELRGVLDGILSGKISVAASGYTVGDVQKSLTGNGNFAFNNFVYSSKELNEALNQKLNEKLGKFAPAQGKNIFGGNPGWETVQGTFNIKDEKINVEKILAKEKEYLAEGKGNVDFNNYMDMDFMVTVPYKNLPYEPFKVDKKELSQLPVHLTGPVAKPKLDGAKLVQYFLDKTLANETKKLKEKTNKEVEKIKVQATDKLKQAIKGFKF